MPLNVHFFKSQAEDVRALLQDAMPGFVAAAANVTSTSLTVPASGNNLLNTNSASNRSANSNHWETEIISILRLHEKSATTNSSYLEFYILYAYIIQMVFSL